MPELPEVETTRRAMSDCILNHTIELVTVRNHQLRLPIPFDLASQCVGKRICTVDRRGKYLIIKLTKGYLIIHLGMSGHLRILKSFSPHKKHDHIELQLDNNTILRYNDPRRFGLWIYTEDDPYRHKLLNHLGVEPLTEAFNECYLFDIITQKKQPIKNSIMDHFIVVGVGNIYATESLFKAGINPLLPGEQVSLPQCRELVRHIKATLETAILAGGTTLRDFSSGEGKPGYFAQNLQVYGRAKLACFICGDIINNVKIGGRSSAFCPTCQPL